MKTTVSGTDESGQRHVSQTATSSEAKLDIGTVTTSNQRIIYTTAQLHKIMFTVFFYKVHLQDMIFKT